MASDVLAVILVTALLNSSAYASVDMEKTFTHAEYDIINDTSSFAWQDLRNEIHQDDAITYELGTPQYQILNNDEPLEIIMPDQPGYYESLKRYEEAAQQQAEENQNDATTTPPEGTKEQTKIRKDEQKAELSIGEKQIRFIILNSKKKSKNPKLYLELSKNYQQDVTPAEKSEMKTMKLVLSEAAPWTQQYNHDSDAQSKGEHGERVNLPNSVQESKESHVTLLKINATKEDVKPLKKNNLIPNTETIIINNSSTHIDRSIITQSPLKEAITAAEILPEALQEKQPVFLTYNTSPTEETIIPLNGKPKEPYATGMSSIASIYEAPHHIRDFEYLYRSALGL